MPESLSETERAELDRLREREEARRARKREYMREYMRRKRRGAA